MAEAKPPQKQSNEKVITYVPFGETTEIQITPGMVRKYLCTPTKSGAQPTDADIVNFLMLCKSRSLNPWVGDAYLVGYDSRDGPSFSLITAVQALHKRAEIHPSYEGLEAGITVRSGDEIQQREGSLVMQGETLVGGWARCHRSDRKVPYYDEVALSTYSTGRSRWAKDQAGMIKKVAESAVLRRAFPTQIGGLYIAEEMGANNGAVVANDDDSRKSRMEQLTDQLRSQTRQVAPEPEGHPEVSSEDGPTGERFELSAEERQGAGKKAYEYWRERIVGSEDADAMKHELEESFQDDRLTEEMRLSLEGIVEDRIGALT